ncbi:GNAT family N-acetyltransferase [Streptomyces aureus]|uniref:GNAT family N-acetyltransferase n=1 Tax=Streptomyces aureus TaxID=193461 RepID=UPI0006E44252|nr:GNAT family N-acetyltransferase [Streptomyces aureus]
MTQDIRRATSSDVPRVRAVTDAAHHHYVDRIGLDNVAVHPDAQGTGLGRRLLGFVESRVRELGLPEVRLLTNVMMWENQKLYERYGHEVVERRMDGPYDRIHYRKLLNAPPIG